MVVVVIVAKLVSVVAVVVVKDVVVTQLIAVQSRRILFLLTFPSANHIDKFLQMQF